MVIEGEAPATSLEKSKSAPKTSEKKPFAFIERTWEVKNPTEEEVGWSEHIYPIEINFGHRCSVWCSRCIRESGGNRVLHIT